MEPTSITDQINALLRIEHLRIAETIGIGLEVLVLALLTIGAARWTRDRVRRSARAGPVWADVASFAGQGAALLIYAVGFAIILSVVGLNPTAIAAILGAATFGSSLALQDVAKGFVNGAYLMIERPFRVGDQVRIGSDEGRVEEIGIRLTRLRTAGGERINVPSTVVFTSSLENATVGNLSRRQFAVKGIERPITEIERVVRDALKATPHLAPRSPVTEFVTSGPDGTAITVTVVHDLGQHIDADVVNRLRAAFPECTVAVGTSAKAGSPA